VKKGGVSRTFAGWRAQSVPRSIDRSIDPRIAPPSLFRTSSRLAKVGLAFERNPGPANLYGGRRGTTMTHFLAYPIVFAALGLAQLGLALGTAVAMLRRTRTLAAGAVAVGAGSMVFSYVVGWWWWWMPLLPGAAHGGGNLGWVVWHLSQSVSIVGSVGQVILFAGLLAYVRRAPVHAGR